MRQKTSFLKLIASAFLILVFFASVCNATAVLKSKTVVLQNVLIRVSTIVSALPNGNYFLWFLLEHYATQSGEWVTSDYYVQDWVEDDTFQIVTGLKRIPKVKSFKVKVTEPSEAVVKYKFSRFKMAENESPCPKGRIYIHFNTFNNSLIPHFSTVPLPNDN